MDFRQVWNGSHISKKVKKLNLYTGIELTYSFMFYGFKKAFILQYFL